MLAIAAVTAGLISAWRTDTLADNQRATANLAQVLSEQTSRSMQTVDLTLRQIAGDVLSAAANSGTTLSDVMRSRATFTLLANALNGLPQVSALSVIGADGDMLSFSRDYPPPKLNVSDRDYFRHFRETDDHGDFVSSPVVSRADGQWTVFLARRIDTAQGSFGGVILAAIPLSFLEDFYKAAMPSDGAVSVLRRDGTVLVHTPHKEAQIGERMPPESPWYRLVDAGGGSYRSPGYLDGIVYLVSVHPLPDFPLVIDVSRSEAAALAAWQRQTLWLLGGGALAAACAMALLWVFDAQLRRLIISEASLARQNIEPENHQLQFDATLDNISQGVTCFDGDQRLIVCNRRYREIYRLSPEHTRAGTSLSDIVDFRKAVGTFPDMTRPDYLERRRVLAQSGQPFEVVDELPDGRIVSLRYQPLPNGGWVTTHEDITERRRTTAALAFMARHDSLTELPNRTLFQERLDQATALTRRQGGCALLLLDLDGFKAVNDTFGHLVGDALLQAVALRLLSVIRETDTVARLGGDEFAIIQAGIQSPRQAAALAERTIEAVAQPFDVGGHRILVGASVGIAVAPSDGESSGQLLRNADIALYLAKAHGRGTCRLFEPEMDAHVQLRRALELDLREALACGAFHLQYQPFIELRSGAVLGFEALIRWHHPVRGLINPVDFIPIAEDTGLIVGIGKWVLQQACMTAAAWPEDISVAVNLSAVQFRSGHLLQAVETALAESRLAPSRLELEITESVLMQNSDDRLATLHRLRALGVRIALDDFGTGYSSLGYLRSFPFDKIKIDRTFVGDLITNRDSRVIVSAIIGLGIGLGMKVTAEGVETAEQLAALRDEGCAQVQGDLLSRPLAANAVLDWMRAPHRHMRYGREEARIRHLTAPQNSNMAPGLR